MQNLVIWNIENDKPKPLERSFIGLEEKLETWIENDPSLLQSGLEIIGRQIRVDGGRLDLLALDPNGNWVVIEIKRGKVHRETIVQALDYAASIAEMPFHDLKQKINAYLKPTGKTLEVMLEYREANTPSQGNIIIFVAGTERGDGLERIARYLKGVGQEIYVVTYEVHENEYGNRVILRERTDLDTLQSKETVSEVNKGSSQFTEVDTKEANSIETVTLVADKNGLGKEFRYLLDVALDCRLYPRTYKNSIMYTPPHNHTRMLFTVWAKPTKNKLLKVYVGSSAFAEFYPINRIDKWRFLGLDGYREMSMEQVKKFADNLNKLFQKIAQNA